MGEETDIAEPMSSEDVVAAEEVTADEPKHRKRKKHLFKSLKELMEFYLGDVNLSKDRFMSQHIQGQPFVYVDLSLFLTFNKIKALTSSVEDLAKAVSSSDMLQISEDGTQVCRKTPIIKKNNEDECTIYVEQLGPEVNHDVLTKVFSEYGPVDYVSLPRYSHNGKFKGFGFVEFKDPESAKKALEAFTLKGCCLSPHMAPEELMSIRNFDNKENTEAERKGKKDRGTSHHRHDDKIKEHDETGSQLESEETNSTETSTTDRKDNCDGNKKKRKSFEDSEVPKKKRKSKDCNDVEPSDLECSKKVKPEKEDEAFEEPEESMLNEETKRKDKGKKNEKSNKPEEIEEDQSVKDKDEGGKDNVTCNKKKLKRKHSGSEEFESKETDKSNEEEIEPVKKKGKSDAQTEADQSKSEEETCEDAGEDETKQKKKRKRKKKMKKEKASVITLGLKVLPKKEWKQLRNRYLNMQREMMRTLKQQLMYSKWERNKAMVTEADEEKKDKVEMIPGTIVKVVLEQPVLNCKTAKSDMRIHPDIKYVDVEEGSVNVYLRTTTPQVATSLIQARQFPDMQLIQGEEESEYWNKIKLDREEHLKKSKSNHQRGRTKLLKRAERFQGKHITTFESSQN